MWFDYDNDGRLDLFVCNFVDFSKAKNLPCMAYNKPGYCVPTLYKPTASWLFHNNGDGTFTDVSKSSGIAKHLGKAWGVVATDLNNDGKMDLFVANDTTRELSLHEPRATANLKRLPRSPASAYSETGRPRSGMGVDSADFNQDGWMDLFVANIDHERYSLYQNNHDETFDDQANATSIGAATRLMSGWGLKFFDYDNDGNLDLFLANGNPDDLIETMQKDVTYREPLMLFHSDGKTLHNVSAESGPLFARNLSSRGLAIGDFDNDGAVDVLVSVNDAAPLLHAQPRRAKAITGWESSWWAKSRIVTRSARASPIRPAISSAAERRSAAEAICRHTIRAWCSASASATKIDWLEVKWPEPSGKTERFTELPIDKYITIVEGKASADHTCRVCALKA